MNKHFAIDANGTTHTRNSENRVYSHCVAVRFSYERALAEAKKPHRSADSNFHHYAAFLDGTSEFLKQRSWHTAEQHAEQVAHDIEKAKEALAGCATVEEYSAMLIARSVGGVKKAKADGYYDRWHLMGWNSRLDLAQKEAARQRDRASVAEVAILEAKLK